MRLFPKSVIISVCLLMLLNSCKKTDGAKGPAPDLGLTKISILAGSGTAGNADGTGTAATLNQPWTITLDAAGNAYVIDATKEQIRKITPAGVVTTFEDDPNAGGGNVFADANGITVDPGGNFYVSYSTSYCISKISPDGKTGVLFAGSPGLYGFQDGTGTDARFTVPVGLASDASGNIYVADAGNGAIRKITPAGVVTTVAGNGSFGSADGPVASAQFNEPYGVALDKSGNIYVADAFNYKVRKITTAGIVSTVAGSGTQGYVDGSAGIAGFFLPSGLAVAGDGNIYVCDYGTSAIRKIATNGQVSTVGRDISYNGFNGPFDLVIDKTGALLIADKINNQIKKVIPPK